MKNIYVKATKFIFSILSASLLWSGAISASAEEITDEQLIETLETPDTFTVKVPKTISVNSAGNILSNIISNGTIKGYEKLQISIPDTITMTQNGKSSVKCNIASENTEITFNTLKQTANTNFSINTNKLTAGTWTGKIEISITKEYYPGLYSKDFKTYIPWNEFVKENGDYFGEKQETTNTNYTSFQKLTDAGKINTNGILVYTDNIDWNTKLYIQDSNLSAVIYPDNVININDSFTRSSQLAYIDLSTASTLDECCFNDTPNMQAIHMENSLITRIPNQAFAKTGNAKIYWPSNLKEIGEYSFEYSNIETFDIPDSVWKIEANAFNYSKAKKIIFPTNLKALGYGVAYNSDLEILDMSKCDKLVNCIIKDYELDIPEEVTETSNNSYIGGYCFSNTACTLKTIILNDNIEAIGDSMFRYQSNIETINFPKNLVAIGGYALNGANIEDLDLSECEQLDYIGYYAFAAGGQNYEIINTINLSSCRIIDAMAFRSQSIISFIAPDNLKYLGKQAFESCGSLESVDLSQTDGLSFFAGGSGNRDFKIENNKVILNQINENDYGNSGQFQYCSKLKSVKFGTNMKFLPGNIFTACTSLQTINIPDTVEGIGRFAFQRTGLTEVKLPANLCQFSYYQDEYSNFIDGYSYSDVNNSNKIMGEFAFASCPNLKKVDMSACTKMKILGFSSYNMGSGVFSSCENLETVILPPNLEFLNASQFFGCTSLKNITFPNSLQFIGYEVFKNCSSLQTVNLKNTNVFKIQHDAFYNCSVLTTLILPDSLQTIGESAFYNTYALQNIDLSTCTKLTEIPDSCFEVSSKENCTYSGDSTVIFPDTIKIIGSNAFDKRRDLKNINWPTSLETIKDGAFFQTENTYYLDFRNTKLSSIGKNAFWNCGNIKFVWFPENIQVTIGKDAFKYCGNLYLDIPSNVSISPDNSFEWVSISYEGTDSNYPWNAKYASAKHAGLYNGDNYTPWKELHKSGKICQSGNYIIEGNDKTIAGDLIIPDNVPYIDKNAFSDNDNITSITTGKGLLAIYKWNPFSNCDNLKKLDFGNSINLTSIPVECCINSPKLETVILPDSIVDINCSAFKNCPNLSIDIPDTVNFIGIAALLGVKNINYNGNSDGYPWGAVVVNGVSLNDSVYGMYKDDGSYVSWNNMISSGLICSDAWGYKICNGIDKSKISGTIKFPYEMTGLSTYAFNGCTQLKAVEFSPLFENAWWGTFDNTQIEILDFSKTNLGWIQSNNYANMPNLKTVILDKTPLYDTIWGRKQITEIQTGGFSNNPQMSIVVPSYITTIGENAFLNAKSVTYTGTATGSPWGAKLINGVATSSAKDAFIIRNKITIISPTTVSDGNAKQNNDTSITPDYSEEDLLQMIQSVSDGNAVPEEKDILKQEYQKMTENGISPEGNYIMRLLMQIFVSVILPIQNFY